MEVAYYHHDHNKNVTQLVDPSGDCLADYYYDPYGNILPFSTGTLLKQNPFLYSSEYYDQELNLVYYNYRYYDPVEGRWINRDPIGENGGLNLYGYCSNSITYLVDILGTWSDGNNRKPGPLSSKGHSDFPGSEIFDYTLEDHDPNTSPFNSNATWRHFRSLDNVEKDLAKAVKNCNKENFERYGHQMQDFFAHYGQGFRTNYKPIYSKELGTINKGRPNQARIRFEIPSNLPGHALASIKQIFFHMPRPDNPEDYTDAFNAASERTQLWLDKWHECCCFKNNVWIKKEGTCEEIDIPDNPYGDVAPAPKRAKPKYKRKKRLYVNPRKGIRK